MVEVCIFTPAMTKYVQNEFGNLKPVLPET